MFFQLIHQIDSSNKSLDKIEALYQFFLHADESEILPVIGLFFGKRPKRIAKTNELRSWAIEKAGISDWLFEECYAVAGDLSETISKLLPETNPGKSYSIRLLMMEMNALSHQEEQLRKKYLFDIWDSLSKEDRFVFNKLSSGGFRIGVSENLVVKALAKRYSLEESVISHRLMGNWDPLKHSIQDLLFSDSTNADISKPYPFFLASSIGEELNTFQLNDWIAEYKWDGIRVQLIKRSNSWFLWSRGEELINHSFPEIEILCNALPTDCVIDGELLAIDTENKIQNFNTLQKRLGRKKPSKKILQDIPVCIYAYDLLECDSVDLRQFDLESRRSKLQEIVQKTRTNLLKFSDSISFQNLDELKEKRVLARAIGSEGLMLKRKESVYQTGRKKGDWFKWKLDPYTVDAVMIYAQVGHGRRANLFTDYTFALKNEEGKLLPIAKAYSGLNDAEIKEVDAWVKANTIEKFGPVRSVKAELVFEIGFEGISLSERHKSGVAVRFPRIIRWRKDKLPSEINELEDLRKMIV
ncbi:MAG: ATP-dependent DNA ligase [Bacteroidia bacterium]